MADFELNPVERFHFMNLTARVGQPVGEADRNRELGNLQLSNREAMAAIDAYFRTEETGGTV